MALGLLLAAAPAAEATLIRIEAQADYTGSLAQGLALFGSGTTVSASLSFEVGPGPPSVLDFPTLTNAMGTFTWDNGGPQVFTVNEVLEGLTAADGRLSLGVLGVSPEVAGTVVEKFELYFDLGTNPFTTGEELSDLLAEQAVLTGFRFGGRFSGRPTTIFDSIDSNVTATITPEPSTGALVAIGLAAIGMQGRARHRHRRRTTPRA